VLPSKQSVLKPQSSATPGPKLGSPIDVKRVALVAGVLAVGVVAAIWGISKTFTPGQVTRLEPADPTYVDAGPPAPQKPAEPRRPAPPLTAESMSPAPSRADAAHAPVAAPPRAQAPPRPEGSVVPVAPIPRPGSTPREARLPPPQLRFETFEEVVDSSVYSANDTDVEPPVVLYPQQLGRVPIGVRSDEMAFVEVLLNEEGRVLQVRALESPQSLDESMVLTMSLSAAKTWRFQPARKDGRAVKYRQVMPVSLR
jgi:hypothetical protein